MSWIKKRIERRFHEKKQMNADFIYACMNDKIGYGWKLFRQVGIKIRYISKNPCSILKLFKFNDTTIYSFYYLK